MEVRALTLKIQVRQGEVDTDFLSNSSAVILNEEVDIFRFIKIEPQRNARIFYSFCISKYPVTNSQYERFLKADDFAKEDYWLGFPKFDENCNSVGSWREAGLNWLREQGKTNSYYSRDNWVVVPKYWDDPQFGILRPNHPVVGITWYEANAYVIGLLQIWEALSESSINLDVMPKQIRLPLEVEWVIAAGGDRPEDRYPWDTSTRPRPM